MNKVTKTGLTTLGVVSLLIVILMSIDPLQPTKVSVIDPPQPTIKHASELLVKIDPPQPNSIVIDPPQPTKTVIDPPQP